MFKSKAILALILCLSIFVSSCSSIFNGSTDSVRVISDPDQAEIIVDGVKYGPTPGVVSLQRGDSHVIEIIKDGYEPISIRTSNSITGWFWGNFICGGLLGFVIDLATGNAFDVEPDYINVQLRSDQALNQVIEQNNIDGVNIYDQNNNLVGKINFAWE